MTRPLRRLLSTVTLVALTLTGVGLAGVAAPAASAATDAQSTLFSKINNARENHDERRVLMRKRLNTVAQRHAAKMADAGRLFHNSNLGDEVGHWKRLGENVAAAGSIAEAHRLLMNSSAHRANILDGGFREAGVGIARARDRVWVVQVFRVPTYPRTVGEGSQGEAVKKLQRRLDLRVTGTFGSRTKEAVQRFQARHDKLRPHGTCGFRTWIALGF